PTQSVAISELSRGIPIVLGKAVVQGVGLTETIVGERPPGDFDLQWIGCTWVSRVARIRAPFDGVDKIEQPRALLGFERPADLVVVAPESKSRFIDDCGSERRGEIQRDDMWTTDDVTTDPV